MFKDYFSQQANLYARFRPSYPRRLGAQLRRLAPGTGLAVDCGCGSGQLSVLLTEYFEEVVGIDPSAEQIRNAFSHDRVRYVVAPAESTGLAANSADLIVAAQSAHWFDLPAFLRETARIAKPGALLALVGYGLPSVSPEIDDLIRELHDDILGPYWPPERAIVVAGYTQLQVPYPEIVSPPLAITVTWSRIAFCGYIQTWSALNQVRDAQGGTRFMAWETRLGHLWPDGIERRVTWPLVVRQFRLP
ncbi:MAG: class I SAM-dependent methyltransferase [Ectothiorhodospiraceae bacterium]|nr:class I SAM-dependent methyltransferase [Ectothiorhodospiraceae bacterium]